MRHSNGRLHKDHDFFEVEFSRLDHHPDDKGVKSEDLSPGLKISALSMVLASSCIVLRVACPCLTSTLMANFVLGNEISSNALVKI